MYGTCTTAKPFLLTQFRAQVSDLVDKFEDGYEAVETDASGVTLASCWVHARFLQGETLPQFGQPAPWPKPKPRPSFFRAKERPLHIMKALLPRAPRAPSVPLLHRPVWEQDASQRERLGLPAGQRMAGPVIQFRERDLDSD